jgi:hypothetical protein
MEDGSMNEVLERPQIRRFSVADLTAQGPWIMARLLKTYPNQNERSIIGWLNGLIFNNEFLILNMPNAVCLAETLSLDRLSNKTVVREVFVWCEDPSNPEQVIAAAEFYQHMQRWAKVQNIDRMIVGERTDVPHEMLEKIFDRLHITKTIFVKV